MGSRWKPEVWGNIPKSSDFSQVREHFTTGDVLQDHVQIGIVLYRKHTRINDHTSSFAYGHFPSPRSMDASDAAGSPSEPANDPRPTSQYTSTEHDWAHLHIGLDARRGDVTGPSIGSHNLKLSSWTWFDGRDGISRTETGPGPGGRGRRRRGGGGGEIEMTIWNKRWGGGSTGIVKSVEREI